MTDLDETLPLKNMTTREDRLREALQRLIDHGCSARHRYDLCPDVANARAALSESPREPGLDVERLRLALIDSGQAETYAFSKRWAERIANAYAARAEAGQEQEPA